MFLQVLVWNEKVRFDFILVLFSIIENILVFDLFGTSVESGGSGVNLGFLRLLRLCKIVKILRVFRTLRFFSELRLMLDCVVGSLMNVFWCLIMLIFVMYVFALLLQQGVVQYLQERGNDGSHIGLQEYFSSVGVTVVTLFQSCTSGVDWSEPYKALQPTGWVLPISFLLYIAFAPGWYFQLDACILWYIFSFLCVLINIFWYWCVCCLWRLSESAHGLKPPTRSLYPSGTLSRVVSWRCFKYYIILFFVTLNLKDLMIFLILFCWEVSIVKEN